MAEIGTCKQYTSIINDKEASSAMMQPTVSTKTPQIATNYCSDDWKPIHQLVPYLILFISVYMLPQKIDYTRR